MEERTADGISTISVFIVVVYHDWPEMVRAFHFSSQIILIAALWLKPLRIILTPHPQSLPMNPGDPHLTLTLSPPI